MVKTILKDEHPSRPAFASCLEQYLQRPGQPIQFHNEKFPDHLYETLHEAIEEQTLIGWHHLLLGYTSKKWLLLASMDTPKVGQINLSAGRSRTQVALGATTLMVRDLWLGRNEILHQHQDDKDQTIYSMESAELRHYHSNPNLVPTSDQHYCRNITLNKLLKKPALGSPTLAQTRQNGTGCISQRRPKPTTGNTIHDTSPLDAGFNQHSKDTTNAAQTSKRRHKNHTHEHSTTAHDGIFSRSTTRQLTYNNPKSSALSNLERCQGWVPSATLEKFLLKGNLYNLFCIFFQYEGR
ncbi:hypothetical protein MHU86_2845 [Fragilaria crotonensis]|nr:hypothetical protein MHU86_2845 [Fragilaria crotonensis]